MKLIRTKDDLGNEIYINLDNFTIIRKSTDCRKQPSIDYMGSFMWTQIFANEKERDDLFNLIGTLS